MRASRLLVVVLALALLGLVPTASPASAGRLAATAAERSAALAPQVTAKIVKRRGELVMTGVVKPARGPVVIERATSCNRSKGTCNFKRFRVTKVNGEGRYTTRVFAPRDGSWAWRATKGSTTSKVWLTCVKRPDADCPVP